MALAAEKRKEHRGKRYPNEWLKFTWVGEPPRKCSLPPELRVLVLLEAAEKMHCPSQTWVHPRSIVKVP